MATRGGASELESILNSKEYMANVKLCRALVARYAASQTIEQAEKAAKKFCRLQLVSAVASLAPSRQRFSVLGQLIPRLVSRMHCGWVGCICMW